MPDNKKTGNAASNSRIAARKIGRGPNGQPESGRAISSAPVSRQKHEKIGIPKFTSSSRNGDGRVRIRHREYIGDVNGSVAFAQAAYPVQPGLSSTFPWLSGIAPLYESYLFHSLRFEFETLASTATAGRVMMAIDYDALDVAPANKIGIMSYHDASSCAAWEMSRFIADKKDLEKFGKQRYVRFGAQPANSDLKTYDVGAFYIATQGMGGTTAVGELYVSYDVEFMTPQLQAALALGPNSRKQVSTAGITALSWFGTNQVFTGQNNSITADFLTPSQFDFSTSGQYFVSLSVSGTSLGSISALGGAGGIWSVASPSTTSSASTFMVLEGVFTAITGSTLTITFSGTSFSGTIARFAQYQVSLG